MFKLDVIYGQPLAHMSFMDPPCLDIIYGWPPDPLSLFTCIKIVEKTKLSNISKEFTCFRFIFRGVDGSKKSPIWGTCVGDINFYDNSLFPVGVESIRTEMQQQLVEKLNNSKTKNALFLPDRYRGNFELLRLKSSEFNYRVKIRTTIKKNQKFCLRKNSYEGLKLPYFCHFWAFRSPPWPTKMRGGSKFPFILSIGGQPQHLSK